VTACFIDIDPRQVNTYDTCINCGECITACNTLQAKKSQPGLLSFSFEAKKATGIKAIFNGLSQRARWTLPVTGLGLLMFLWGVWNYQPYHLAVYQNEQNHGANIRNYRVAISNKRYRPAMVTLKVLGLSSRDYTMSRPKAIFDGVGRIDLQMQLESHLKPGLHSFIVQAKSMDGWQQNFRVQHFVAKGG
jgi:polyferredoxin